MDFKRNALMAILSLLVAFPASAKPALLDLQQAAQILKSMTPASRSQYVLDVFTAAEALLLAKGWKLCEGPLQKSDSTPFGFKFFSREDKCFYSAVKNSQIWWKAFNNAPIDDQAYLYMTIERLRTNLATLRPLNDQG